MFPHYAQARDLHLPTPTTATTFGERSPSRSERPRSRLRKRRRKSSPTRLTASFASNLWTRSTLMKRFAPTSARN